MRYICSTFHLWCVYTVTANYLAKMKHFEHTNVFCWCTVFKLLLKEIKCYHISRPALDPLSMIVHSHSCSFTHSYYLKSMWVSLFKQPWKTSQGLRGEPPVAGWSRTHSNSLSNCVSIHNGHLMEACCSDWTDSLGGGWVGTGIEHRKHLHLPFY